MKNLSIMVHLWLFGVSMSTILASSVTTTVNITDGELLKEYLCSPSQTIPPNTHLVLHSEVIELKNLTSNCIVENTTNIRISRFSSLTKPVNVTCNSTMCSLAFFNVTNLAIESVYFSCGWEGISEMNLRYLNKPYYDQLPLSSILFNHCYNLTLYNSMSDDCITGVNLCGWSNITAIVLDEDVPESPLFSLFVYYMDSAIMSSAVECNLHIESNVLSGNSYFDGIEELFSIKFYNRRDFVLILAQQDFEVNSNVIVLPMLYFINSTNDMFCLESCGFNAVIVFVNCVTDSHVTFQGYTYEFALSEPHSPPGSQYRPIQLDVVFYETPSLSNVSVVDDVRSPLLVKNSSFVFNDAVRDSYIDKEVRGYFRVFSFLKRKTYQITMENVAWYNNTVLFIDHTYVKWYHLLSVQNFGERTLYLTLKNTHVQYNYGKSSAKPQRNSGSLFTFVNTNVTMSGSTLFGHNFGGSAIELIASNLTLTGKAFINDGNTFKGGALRLDGLSFLFLKEPLFASFVNNSARQGSAIYAPALTTRDANGTTISAIQVEPVHIYSVNNVSGIDIKLYFSNYETSMYSPDFSFTGKQLSPNFLFQADTWKSKRQVLFASTVLFDSIFMGSDTDKYDSLFDGFCVQVKGEKQQCDYLDWTFSFKYDSDLLCNDRQAHVLPGETALSLTCDDSKHYQFALYYPDERDLYSSSKLSGFQEVSCESKKYQFWETTYYPENASMTVMFRYNGDEEYDPGYCLLLGNSERSRSIPFMHIIVNSDCPVGFSLTKDHICGCDDKLMEHNFKCFINNRSFISPPHYWVDMDMTSNTYDGFKLSSNCPPNRCKNTLLSKDFNLSNAQFLSDEVCIGNHTGVLCGQCKRNHSAVFGSDACYAHCSNLYLLTFPLYALAGIVLVIVLFALRLTVATGTINGLIFYANVLELSMSVFSREYTELNFTPFRIFISLLNLDLGFPVCFYEGMTQAGKAGFQFVFPVYLWTIVLVLIVASRISTKISELVSNNAVQVLATLFFLSFSKLLVSSIYVFSPASYFQVDNSYNASYLVWYYGGTDYGMGIHGYLIAVAVVFAAFFVLPYAVFLTIPCVLARLKEVNRFKPLFDAYGGPFKDKWRFWFGLRLWVTAAMLVVDGVLQGTDSDKMLTAHFVIVLFFVILQAHVTPFKKQLVGAVDMFFMMNYLLIATFYLQFKQSQSIFAKAYIFLLSIAMLMFFAILLFHFFHTWIYRKKLNTFRNWKQKFYLKFKKYGAIESEIDEHSDEYLFQAADQRAPINDTY